MTSPKPDQLNQTLKRLSEQPELDCLSFLLYGGSGTGKTWALGTAGSRTLIIDTGNGLATLKSLAFKTTYPDINPLVVNIKESKISRTGQVEGKNVKGFDAVCDIIDQGLKHNASDFDTIGIDEMSAFSISTRYKAMEFNAVAKNTDSFKKAQLNKMIPMPEMNDYQTEQNTIAWFFRTYIPILAEMGKKLIVLAHERTEYQPAKKFGEEVKILRIMPAVAGKKEFAPAIFPSLFSEVWRMTAEGRSPNVLYRAHTTGSDIIVGKTRHGGVIKDVETNINFQDIFNRIEKEIPSVPPTQSKGIK